MGREAPVSGVFDIAVVGAGPAGLAMAAALVTAAEGMTVALVAPEGSGSDPRASAVAAGGRNLLVAIGAWAAIAPHSNPVARMVLTDSGGRDLARPELLALEGEIAPGEPMAHMVPNDATHDALGALIAGRVTRVAATVTGFSAQQSRAELTLSDGTRLAARLVVAADGGQSRLRALAGIPVFAHDYGQSGVVTTIAHARPHEDTAYQHFRPEGPFASLPLPGNRSSLVWAQGHERAQALCAMAPEMVAREIEAAMGSVLGAITVVAPVKRFALTLRLARRPVAQRLTLIGDAAHVIHPLAGQGFNLGLKDVAALAECVVDGMRLGLDPADQTILDRYARWRAGDTLMMAAATDGLNRLFSNDNTPLRAVRDMGMAIVDRAGPLKAAFIDVAAGASGPKLLRGEMI